MPGEKIQGQSSERDIGIVLKSKNVIVGRCEKIESFRGRSDREGRWINATDHNGWVNTISHRGSGGRARQRQHKQNPRYSQLTPPLGGIFSNQADAPCGPNLAAGQWNKLRIINR